MSGGYLDYSGRADRLGGGARRIPVDTPGGRFSVWTKRVGNNPDLKVLLRRPWSSPRLQLGPGRWRCVGPGDGELVTAADALEPGGDAVLNLLQALGVSGFCVQGQRAGGGPQGAAPPAEVDDPLGSG
jgi:hypothetical protein